MPVKEALAIINDNDATILSKISFKKPNTIATPILVSRLQAGGGLLSIGSIVDIYTTSPTNNTNQTVETNETSPEISGCTVLAIIQCKESGTIESEYIKTHTIVQGNLTNPNEDTKSFSTDVEEMIKGAIVGGYNEENTAKLLDNYGLKLSDYERQINLGDLDSEYILLIETPANKVDYLLENMDKIILTIPTQNAPDWMVNEISSTYKK